MTITKEAWKDGRPVLNRLPGINGGYSDLEVSDWVTAFWDVLLSNTRDKLLSFSDNLNPDTAAPEWLGYLSILMGANDGYYDSRWSDGTKRAILAQMLPELWPNRGTPAVMSAILNAIGIPHRIRQKGDFIIGESRIGDELTTSGWQYTITVPVAYYGDPSSVRAIKTVIRLYGPAYAEATVLYDDSLFEPPRILNTDQGEYISVGDNKILGL